jgi:hypothetical protein
MGLSEIQNLGPVGIFDGGLQLVWANGTLGQSGGKQRHTLSDAGCVPETPVLLGERDEFAAGTAAGGPPRIGQQQEREQSGGLGIAGQHVVNGPRQADGLVRQFAALQVRAGAAGIAFIEDSDRAHAARRVAARPVAAAWVTGKVHRKP